MEFPPGANANGANNAADLDHGANANLTPSKTRAGAARHRRNSGRQQQQPLAAAAAAPPPIPSLPPPIPSLADTSAHFQPPQQPHPPPHPMFQHYHARDSPSVQPAANFLAPTSASAVSSATRRRATAAQGATANMAAATAVSPVAAAAASPSPVRARGRRGRQMPWDSDLSDMRRESAAVAKLNKLLSSTPAPACSYRVRRSVGMGTFSTVYLAEKKAEAAGAAPTHPEGDAAEASSKGEKSKQQQQRQQQQQPPHPERIAIKHLIPTSSPDRILMEVECLRLCHGQHVRFFHPTSRS